MASTYDKVLEDDSIDIIGLINFAVNQLLNVILHHEDGTSDSFSVNHTYNDQQIKWFKAGAASNIIRKEFENRNNAGNAFK